MRHACQQSISVKSPRDPRLTRKKKTSRLLVMEGWPGSAAVSCSLIPLNWGPHSDHVQTSGLRCRPFFHTLFRWGIPGSLVFFIIFRVREITVNDIHTRTLRKTKRRCVSAVMYTVVASRLLPLELNDKATLHKKQNSLKTDSPSVTAITGNYVIFEIR